MARGVSTIPSSVDKISPAPLGTGAYRCLEDGRFIVYLSWSLEAPKKGKGTINHGLIKKITITQKQQTEQGD